jgi:hypothetical protein
VGVLVMKLGGFVLEQGAGSHTSADAQGRLHLGVEIVELA